MINIKYSKEKSLYRKTIFKKDIIVVYKIVECSTMFPGNSFNN